MTFPARRDESMETPGAYRPFHRSPIAAAVWCAYASGPATGWTGGRMVHPFPDRQDDPYFPELSRFGRFSPPDWIRGLVSALDGVVPPSAELAACLDPDSLTLPPSPAAFRIPASPAPGDAGTCLAASRILAACLDDLLPPAFVGSDRAGEWLLAASAAACMLGGEAAYVRAHALLSDPGSYARSAPAAGDDAIAFGDAEDAR